MANYMKTVFEFQDTQGHGWSETWFSSKGTQQQAIDAATAFIPATLGIRGSNTSLTYIRCSSDDSKRDALVYSVPPGIGQAPGGASVANDISNTALIIRLTAGPSINRTLFLRGIPDKIIANAGQVAPDAPWGIAATAWSLGIQTAGFTIRSRDYTTPLIPITAIAALNPPNQIQITTVAPHGLAIGQPVLIRGVKPSGYISGFSRVYATPTNGTFVILTNKILPFFTSFGAAGPVVYQNTAITAIQIMRAGERKSGRVFGVPLGRRRGLRRV